MCGSLPKVLSVGILKKIGIELRIVVRGGQNVFLSTVLTLKTKVRTVRTDPPTLDFFFLFAYPITSP